MLLRDDEATRDEITARLKEIGARVTSKDLIVFYYAGNAVRPNDLKIEGGGPLMFGTYDFDLSRPEENLTIQDVADQIGVMASRHKLIILDTCYGTSGLELEWTDKLQKEATDALFQVFAGSQDDQIANERADLGGGAFTQMIIEVLSAPGHESGTSIPMSRLVADVSARFARYTDMHQQPKLVTVAGSGEIIWKQ